MSTRWHTAPRPEAPWCEFCGQRHTDQDDTWWRNEWGQPTRRRPDVPPCPCECNPHGGFCGGCGHAGCGGLPPFPCE